MGGCKCCLSPSSHWRIQDLPRGEGSVTSIVRACKAYNRGLGSSLQQCTGTEQGLSPGAESFFVHFHAKEGPKFKDL